ncbi:MAG TPA: 2-dehydropantoate 2-reductase [Acidimicrobiia bacterium]|nr:2-dehydropantoate 2-reductase [Acidimicrobiia bacterium]
MRICVVGAGAIGSLLGGKLANSGHQVSMLARGNHLEQIRRNGLLIVDQDGNELVVRNLKVSDQVTSLGAPEVVILAVKAHQVGAIAPALAPLLETDTAVVTVQNGIPWWFFHRLPGRFEGQRLTSIDPDGSIDQHIDHSRVIGSIAYPAAERPAPGVVRVIEGDQFPVGELDGSRSDRVAAIATALSEAGFRARVLTDIRSHLWVKAWGNLAFNPISALTRATLAEICRNPHTRALAAAMMAEAGAIAESLGIRLRVTIDQRIAGAEAVGDHKTSMLQDLEAGREFEVEALVGSFVELGTLTGTPTPTIESIYACVRLLAQTQHLTP